MGKTPYPHIEERPLPDKFGAGMSWLSRWDSHGHASGPWDHTMLGTLWGTDAYFRLLSVLAATDYGIGGALDGAYDGVIFRWINYFERRMTAGWASGWSNAPDYDDEGRAFVDTFGIWGINGGGRSKEHSGMIATPMTPKQWASSMHLSAAIHHNECGKGYEEKLWDMQHWEVAEKECPFERFRKFTMDYKRGIVLIMEHFETGRDIPHTIKIGDLDVILAGGADPAPAPPPADKPIMIAFPKIQIFHTRQGALSRQWAYTGADVVRRYPTDTSLRTVGYYHGQEVSGDDRWLVIKSPGISNNARIHVSGVKERIIDPAIDKD